MIKKNYSHSCKVKPSANTKQKSGDSKMRTKGKNAALTEIFNKYYKDQVSALYRAIQI
ncbi:MAG: hypothetical protein ABH883_05590 [Candidatus Omnitrophota bacterium]